MPGDDGKWMIGRLDESWIWASVDFKPGMGYDQNMNEKPLFVRTEWDDEAEVWVATSDDVPGLATEADTMEGLISKLKVIIPELLELNGTKQDRDSRSFEILSRRFESIEHAGV